MANSIPYSERKFDRKHANEYGYQYKKDHYDRINLQLPKGYKEKLKAAAEKEGLTMTEFIKKTFDDVL